MQIKGGAPEKSKVDGAGGRGKKREKPKNKSKLREHIRGVKPQCL